MMIGHELYQLLHHRIKRMYYTRLTVSPPRSRSSSIGRAPLNSTELNNNNKSVYFDDDDHHYDDDVHTATIMMIFPDPRLGHHDRSIPDAHVMASKWGARGCVRTDWVVNWGVDRPWNAEFGEYRRVWQNWSWKEIGPISKWNYTANTTGHNVIFGAVGS